MHVLSVSSLLTHNSYTSPVMKVDTLQNYMATSAIVVCFALVTVLVMHMKLL